MLSTLSILLLFPSIAYAAEPVLTLPTLALASAVVGIITAAILYRTAHANKRVDLEGSKAVETPINDRAVKSTVRDLVKKLPMAVASDEATVDALSKIVEDQTQQLVRDIKQEYSVKYQVVVQEKNREVEGVKKEYNAVKEKYQEVEKKYKKSDAERKTTEAVVRSIAEGLVVVNQKGEVLLMNPSAERLLGVNHEKKVGKLLHEEVKDEVMISMTRGAGGDDNERVIEFRSKDENVKKIIRSSSAVIQNEDGQTVGMVNILTDVTKQKELDEIKNKFVSNVTHELRTPIVAMQKAMSILQNPSAGELNETQSNFINIVSRNLGHLSRLVEDLLDMAKIESGKMRLKMVPTRVDKVVIDACDMLDTWAKSKNICIEKEIEKGLPEIALDPDKIMQVLNNLIGNAIKFTPPGGRLIVKIGFDLEGRHIRVSVIDSGIGIAKENLPKLFSRFEQFGDQQGISGTGLGLSIAKEIVERHGGQIFAESQEKKGSTFTFILPIHAKRVSGA